MGCFNKHKRAYYFKQITILSSLGVILSVPSGGAYEKPMQTIIQEVKTYRLSLKEVMELALQNNVDIQLAKYDTLIARTKKGESLSLFDTILEAQIKYHNDQSKQASTIAGSKTIDNDYNLGLSKKFSSGTTLNVDMANNRHWTNSLFTTLSPSHNSSLGFSITQELGRNFFGALDKGEVRLAQLDIENSQFSSLEKIEDSVASAQKAYWDLVLAIDLEDVAQKMLAQAEKLYRTHQEKLQNGLVELPQVYHAHASYKARFSELLIAQKVVKEKINVLKLFLNVDDPSAEIMPTEELSLPSEQKDYPTAIQLAFQNRRDYKRLLNEVKLRNLQLSLNENKMWPEINLKASLARNGIGDHFKQAVDQVGGEDNPDFLSSIEISFPLENTKAKSQVQKAELEKARTILELKYIERKIVIGLMDDVRGVNILFEQARLRQEIADLQEKKLQEEEKMFQVGRSNTDTIIRFQEDWLHARSQAAQAMFDFMVALIDLEKDQGTLLSQYWEGEI